MERAIGTFIDDVREILEKDGPSDPGMDRMAGRMRDLVRDPAVRAAHEEMIAVDGSGASGIYVDPGRQAQVVYTDDSGLTLVRARFDPVEPTAIHSHGTWGVLGVYAGRDRHEAWRRTDGGTGAGHATLELVQERVLEPGDAAVIPHPPQDIHRQQGCDGEPAWELVLFGANAMVVPRLIFDLEGQTAREVLPGQG